MLYSTHLFHTLEQNIYMSLLFLSLISHISNWFCPIHQLWWLMHAYYELKFTCDKTNSQALVNWCISKRILTRVFYDVIVKYQELKFEWVVATKKVYQCHENKIFSIWTDGWEGQQPIKYWMIFLFSGFFISIFWRVSEANDVLISSHIWVTSTTFKQL